MRKFILFFLALASTSFIYAQNNFFKWGKSISSTSTNHSKKIAIDPQGNVYTIGSFMGTASFDPGVSSSNLTTDNATLENIYLRKSDAHGNFLWVKSFDGPDGYGNGIDLAFDASGNIIITGNFGGTLDFNPGVDYYGLTSTYRSYSSGGTYTQDIFICKLDADGNFIWAKSMGGNFDDYVNGINTDAQGNILTTGYFYGTADFNPGFDRDTLSGLNYQKKIFISKLNSNGIFQWVKSVEGDAPTVGKDITTDADGNVYTTGLFWSTLNSPIDFDPSSRTAVRYSQVEDAFVSKLDVNGNFLWVKTIGGAGYDECNSITLDANRNIYTTSYLEKGGQFYSGVGAPIQLADYGKQYILINKLNTNGGFIWSKAIKSGSYIRPYGISLDDLDNIYTTGEFNDSSDFDPGPDSSFLVSKGFSDCFISKLDSGGNYVWAKSIGGKKYDYSFGIALDSYRNVYITGDFQDTLDVNPGTDTVNIFVPSRSVAYNSFISKIGTPCNSSSSLTVVSICSSNLPYLWNGKNYSAQGTFTHIATNIEGCDSTAVLVLNVSASRPLAPTSVTQRLIDTTCSARIYRYTSGLVNNANAYSWIIPNSLGGISGVTVDSGNINSSSTIRLKYTSNTASLTTDSIKVSAYSACGTSAYKAFRLTHVALNPPAVPASIVIQKITDNQCGKPRYRYIAPLLPNATGTMAKAMGYDWTFTGNLGAQVVVDSGSLSSRIFTVYYNSNLASALSGDSVKIRYTSGCGFSLYKALKLSNTLVSTNPPLAPASVTQTLVSDACGARVFRYTAPTLPVSNTSNYAANGYSWSLPEGPLGSTGVLDSGSLVCATCRIIRVKYSNNAGALTGDSIGLKYTSLCGLSPKKSFKLVVPSSPPAAPATITQTLVSNVCSARVYRYSTTALPTGTSATGYNWQFKGSLFGTLNANSFIDSGTLTSRVLLVRYTSNIAAAIGDSAKVQYNSACGVGAFRAAKLINVVLACPQAAPPALYSKNSEINYKQKINSIELYPNPSNSFFHLKVNAPVDEKVAMTLLDISGRVLLKMPVTANKTQAFGNDLKPGVYFMEIKQGNERRIERMVKYN